MKAVGRASIYLLTTVVLTLVSQVAFGWGFWTHRTIDSHAVTLLPEPLRDFYEAHVDYVTAHAVYQYEATALVAARACASTIPFNSVLNLS